MLLICLAVAAVGNAVYHLGQKSVPGTANPMLALMGAYAVAFVLATVSAPFFRAGAGVPWTSQMFNWPVVVLGAGIVFIEAGFLLAYRVGGSLQWSGVAANTGAALLLVPVALLVFRESFSLTRLAGLGLCLAGLALLARK